VGRHARQMGLPRTARRQLNTERMIRGNGRNPAPAEYLPRAGLCLNMIQYRPQLEHPMNPIVKCFGPGNLIRQGPTMHRFKHRYLDAGPTPGVIDRTGGRVGRLGTGTAPGLRYSSPWPWAVALGISLSMWTGIVWFVRLFV
jgi:hypothetical protein